MQKKDGCRVTDEIELTIDGLQLQVAPGTTLLQAAKQAGVDVPVICYFEHTTANGLCRMCVVESEGGRALEAACVAQGRPGQIVPTRPEKGGRGGAAPPRAPSSTRPPSLPPTHIRHRPLAVVCSK